MYVKRMSYQQCIDNIKTNIYQCRIILQNRTMYLPLSVFFFTSYQNLFCLCLQVNLFFLLNIIRVLVTKLRQSQSNVDQVTKVRWVVFVYIYCSYTYRALFKNHLCLSLVLTLEGYTQAVKSMGTSPEFFASMHQYGHCFPHNVCHKCQYSIALVIGDEMRN